MSSLYWTDTAGLSVHKHSKLFFLSDQLTHCIGYQRWLSPTLSDTRAAFKFNLSWLDVSVFIFTSLNKGDAFVLEWIYIGGNHINVYTYRPPLDNMRLT